MLKSVRYDQAIDEFYMPYAAAKYGGKCTKALFKTASCFIDDNTATNNVYEVEYDQELIKQANAKLQAHINAHNQKINANIE